MKSKKIWANFSVKDAKRTHQFYTQLGFTPNKLNNDPKLASFRFGDVDFVISNIRVEKCQRNYFHTFCRNRSGSERMGRAG